MINILTNYLPEHWYLYLICIICANYGITFIVKMIGLLIDNCNKKRSKLLPRCIKIFVQGFYGVINYTICFFLCKSILYIYGRFNNYKIIDDNSILILAAYICIVTLLFACLPVWEWKYRIFDTRRLTIDENKRIAPIFGELYNLSCERYGIKKFDFKIKIRMIDNEEPNAFAYGYRLVIITSGLLAKLNDNEVKGIIAHEIGHLFNEDSVRYFFNAGLTFFYTMTKSILIGIYGLVKSVEILYIVTWPLIIILCGITYIFNKIDSLSEIIYLSFSRHQEYMADKFAVSVGQQNNLLDALKVIDTSRYKGLIDHLELTHPIAQFRNEALKYGYNS
jgi:Zn-dependent protease with chaperone function